MSTVSEVMRKLKNPPGYLKLVFMVDGQYYDVDVSNIRSIYVKREKDWAEMDCYGIADEEDDNSFQVYAIE